MSSTPDIPPDPPPPDRPPQRQGGGGFLALGIVTGFAVLFSVYLALVFLAGPSWAAAIAPIVVFLVVAIVLTVRPRTRMFGAGLLIGLGVWALLGGGLCVPLLIPSGGVA
ncbi:hypothetical protein ACFFGH_29015 [Lysobacter korlensis]|uniref:Transmembrane protein n=1 Tax=Lysobacter korlensis TaxID=553636 RepID=A0ABV6RZ62_9GAMM